MKPLTRIQELESSLEYFQTELKETQAALEGLHNRPLSPDEIKILSIGFMLKRQKIARSIARTEAILCTENIKMAKADFFHSL